MIGRGLVVAALLVLVFIGVDGVASEPEAFSGVVVDKQYKAEQNSTGMGYGGDAGVIVTTAHDAEEFLLLVKVEDGKIATVKCEPEIYYQKKVGQKIDCKAYRGYFTGWVWLLRGEK